MNESSWVSWYGRDLYQSSFDFGTRWNPVSVIWNRYFRKMAHQQKNNPMSSATTLDITLERKRRCTQQIMEIKREKKLTWEGMAKAVGRSPVWVTACCLGEGSMDEPSAEKLVNFVATGSSYRDEIKAILMEPPIKAQVTTDVLLQDPCVYRLHEVTLVYGNTIKELIQEKFGDGIMSAIDFKMEIEREEDPQGDRVRIVMSGKYLPYKRW